jgi:hypothetical protein
VVDAEGCAVAYVEPESTGAGLHWVDCQTQFDEKLGLEGSDPALSDDGRYLAYRNKDGNLAVYDRAVRTSVTGLLEGKIGEFSIGGQSLFATIGDGSLVRMGLEDGVVWTILDPVPELARVSSDSGPVCLLVCYGPQEANWFVSSGMVMWVGGSNLQHSGWVVQLFGESTELHPVDERRAWFQIPAAASSAANKPVPPAEIFWPERPDLRLSIQLEVNPRYARCLDTLHEDHARPVTKEDPALPGETIRLIVTGLEGTEPVAIGEPNPADRVIPIAMPPQIQQPDAAEIKSAILSPGQIGLQQIDLTIKGPFKIGSLFAFAPGYVSCDIPAVATTTP